MQKKAFTIIEFLLAFVIISIALIGGSAFFYANAKNIVHSDITRLATWKAIEKIETLKAADYSQIPVGTTTENIAIGNTQAQRITIVTEDTSVSLKTVNVQVVWNNNNISLSTMIAKQ